MNSYERSLYSSTSWDHRKTWKISTAVMTLRYFVYHQYAVVYPSSEYHIMSSYISYQYAYNMWLCYTRNVRGAQETATTAALS